MRTGTRESGSRAENCGMDAEDRIGAALIEDLFAEADFTVAGIFFEPVDIHSFRENEVKTRESVWCKNRKQAIGRFLAGRKLGEKTRRRYNLTAEFLEALEGGVDPDKKWRYDRRAYVRRREKYGKIPSARLQTVYRLGAGRGAGAAQGAQATLPFRKKRSPRRTRAPPGGNGLKDVLIQA